MPFLKNTLQLVYHSEYIEKVSNISISDEGI